jgi:hypothetical protein
MTNTTNVSKLFARSNFTAIEAPDRLSPFQIGYLTAALFTTNDESDPETGGDPLDDNHDIGNIDATCLARLCQLCDAFETAMADTIDAAACKRAGNPDEYASDDPVQIQREQAGHDMWMNSNGHGCGFWDGDWSEPHAKQLDAAARAVGEVNLYVGDDGVIYAMGFEA